MSEATATSLAAEFERTPCFYRGADELEGAIIDGDGVVRGEYWEQDGLLLFQNGSKVYSVSDEDLVRTPLVN